MQINNAIQDAQGCRGAMVWSWPTLVNRAWSLLGAWLQSAISFIARYRAYSRATAGF